MTRASLRSNFRSVWLKYLNIHYNRRIVESFFYWFGEECRDLLRKGCTLKRPCRERFGVGRNLRNKTESCEQTGLYRRDVGRADNLLAGINCVTGCCVEAQVDHKWAISAEFEHVRRRYE
jgi:hypothetical protein